jgi:Zn-dependent protease with chaperone function
MESFALSSGWVAVLVSLGAAVVLPVIIMGLAAFCLPRPRMKNSDEHWAERARRLFPFKALRIYCLIMLPILYAIGGNFYPDSILPIPRWTFCSLLFLVTFGPTNWIIWRFGRRYQLQPESFGQRLRNIAANALLYVLYLLFAITAAILPEEWNWRCAVVLSAGLLVYFWLQFDGILRIGRWLGFFRPADQELTEIAREVAHYWQRPTPSAWLYYSGNANAYALPFTRAVLVTEKARALFSPDEMKAVLAHELAHLHEDKSTRLIRLLTPLLYIPLIKVILLFLENPEKGLPFLALCPVIMAGLAVLGRRRRRMEVRADVYGSWLHEDKSIYARALAKLYEANEMPAVMHKKRLPHPDLYDRLLVAGITPDFVRPDSPARWGTWLGVLLLLASLAAFMGIQYSSTFWIRARRFAALSATIGFTRGSSTDLRLLGEKPATLSHSPRPAVRK